jgi:hypothetical protein
MVATTMGAVSAQFIPTESSKDWVFESNANNPDQLRVGGIKLTGNGSIAASQLGVVKWQFTPQTSVGIALEYIEVGPVSVPTHRLEINLKNTSATGWVDLNPLGNANYSLFVGRTTTDGTFNSGITAADALAALQLAAGINPNGDPDGNGPLLPAKASPYQFFAADVNDDGLVSSVDALTILKMSVGLPGAPMPSWIFVNEKQDFWDETTNKFSVDQFNAGQNRVLTVSDPANSKTNLVGFIKGDVNGSWRSETSKTVDLIDPNYFANLVQVIGGSIDQWGLVPPSG